MGSGSQERASISPDFHDGREVAIRIKRFTVGMNNLAIIVRPVARTAQEGEVIPGDMAPHAEVQVCLIAIDTISKHHDHAAWLSGQFAVIDAGDRFMAKLLDQMARTWHNTPRPLKVGAVQCRLIIPVNRLDSPLQFILLVHCPSHHLGSSGSSCAARSISRRRSRSAACSARSRAWRCSSDSILPLGVLPRSRPTMR